MNRPTICRQLWNSGPRGVQPSRDQDSMDRVKIVVAIALGIGVGLVAGRSAAARSSADTDAHRLSPRGV